MLRRATLTGLAGSGLIVLVIALVVAGGSAGAMMTRTTQTDVTNRAAPLTEVKAEQARTIRSFGLTPQVSAGGIMASNAIQPNDVPCYYHRCWSFIDATFHVKTQHCPGLIYRFSTYNGDWEWVNENTIRDHGYDVAFGVEADYLKHKCFGSFACASIMGGLMYDAAKLGWKLAPRAWTWAKIGIDWIIGVLGAEGL